MNDKVEFKLELSKEIETALYQLADKARMSADEYLENLLWKHVNGEKTLCDDKEEIKDYTEETGAAS